MEVLVKNYSELVENFHTLFPGFNSAKHAITEDEYEEKSIELYTKIQEKDCENLLITSNPKLFKVIGHVLIPKIKLEGVLFPEGNDARDLLRKQMWENIRVIYIYAKAKCNVSSELVATVQNSGLDVAGLIAKSGIDTSMLQNLDVNALVSKLGVDADMLQNFDVNALAAKFGVDAAAVPEMLQNLDVNALTSKLNAAPTERSDELKGEILGEIDNIKNNLNVTVVGTKYDSNDLLTKCGGLLKQLGPKYIEKFNNGEINIEDIVGMVKSLKDDGNTQGLITPELIDKLDMNDLVLGLLSSNGVKNIIGDSVDVDQFSGLIKMLPLNDMARNLFKEKDLTDEEREEMMKYYNLDKNV